MDHWKKVIFEWIKACDFLELNLLTLEDSQPDEFFELFAEYVGFKPSDSRSPNKPLIDFLEEYYPDFTPELNKDGNLAINDYPIVYTIFLHYVNFNDNIEFFSDVYEILPYDIKRCIDLFIERIERAPYISRPDLYNCIANLPSEMQANAPRIICSRGDSEEAENAVGADGDYIEGLPGKRCDSSENRASEAGDLLKAQIEAAEEIVENEAEENEIILPESGDIACSPDYLDTFDDDNNSLRIESEDNGSVDISVTSPLQHSTPYSSDKDCADSPPTKNQMSDGAGLSMRADITAGRPAIMNANASLPETTETNVPIEQNIDENFFFSPPSSEQVSLQGRSCRGNQNDINTLENCTENDINTLENDIITPEICQENKINTPENFAENDNKTAENFEENHIFTPENCAENGNIISENSEENDIIIPENFEESDLSTPMNSEESDTDTSENCAENGLNTPENSEESDIDTPENCAENDLNTPENFEENDIDTSENCAENDIIPENFEENDIITPENSEENDIITLENDIITLRNYAEIVINTLGNYEENDIITPENCAENESNNNATVLIDDNLDKDQVITRLNEHLKHLQAKYEMLARKMEMSDRNSESHRKRINELQSLVDDVNIIVEDKETMIKILRTEHEELMKRLCCVCQELSYAKNKNIKADPNDAKIDLEADVPDHVKPTMRSLHEQNESMANELKACKAKLQAVLRSHGGDPLELPQDDNPPSLLQMIESAMDQIASNSQIQHSQTKESSEYKRLKVELDVAESLIIDLRNQLKTSTEQLERQHESQQQCELSDQLNGERRQNELLRAELEECQDQLSARTEFMLQLKDQLDDHEWNDLEALLNRLIASKSQLRLKKAEANGTPSKFTKLHFICSLNHETLSAEERQLIVQPAGGEPHHQQLQLEQKLMAEMQKCVEQKLAQCIQQLRAHDTIATDLLDLLRESNKLPQAGLGVLSSDRFDQLRTQLVQLVSNYKCLEMVKREAPTTRNPQPSERGEVIKQLVLQFLSANSELSESASQAKQLSIEVNEFASEYKDLHVQCQKLQDQLDYRTSECNWFGEQLSGHADYIRVLESQEPADKRRQKLTALLESLKEQLLEHLKNVRLLNVNLSQPCAGIQLLAVHQKRLALLTDDLKQQLLTHIVSINELVLQQKPLTIDGAARSSEVQYLEQLLKQLKEQLSTQTGEFDKLDLELKSCPPPERQAELQTQLKAIRHELYVLNKKRVQLNQQLLDVELMPELLPMHQKHVTELQLQLQAARELIGVQQLLANMKERLDQNQRESMPQTELHDDPDYVQLQQQVKDLEAQLDASQGLSQPQLQKQDDANQQISQPAHKLLKQLVAAQKRIQELESSNQQMCHKKQLLEEVQLQLREKQQQLLEQLKIAQDSVREGESERVQLARQLKTYQGQAESLQQVLDQSNSLSSEREAQLESQLSRAKQEIDERRKERRKLKQELLKHQQKEQQLRQLEEQLKELEELKQMRDQRRLSDTETQLVEKLKIVTQDLYKRESSYKELIKTANNYHQQLQQLKQAQQQDMPLIEQLNAAHQEVQKWKTAYTKLSETINYYHQQVHQLQEAQKHPDRQLVEELRTTQQSLHEEETAHKRLMIAASGNQQQVDRLQQELDETRRQIDELLKVDEQQEPRERECLHERLIKKMANYRGRLERLQRELNEKDEKLMEAEKRAEKNNRSHEQLGENSNQIKLERQLNDVCVELQKRKDKQKQLSKELASYKNRAERLQRQLAEAKAKLIVRQPERGSLVRQLAEAHQHMRDQDCTHSKLSKKLVDYKHRMEGMTEQVNNAQETKTKLCSVTNQLKSVQQELDEINAKQADISKELLAAKQKEETLQKQLKLRDEELHKLQQVQLLSLHELDEAKLKLEQTRKDLMEAQCKQNKTQVHLKAAAKQLDEPKLQPKEVKERLQLTETQKQDNNTLKQEPTTLHKSLKTQQEKNATLEAKQSKLVKEQQWEVNKLQKKVDQLHFDLNKQTAQIAAYERREREYYATTRHHQSQGNHVELNRLKRLVDKLREQRSGLLAEVKTHKELASRAEHELAELLQKTSKQSQPPTNQVEVNRLNSLVEKLQEERTNLLQENEVMRANMKRHRDLASRSESDLAQPKQESTKQPEPPSNQLELYRLKRVVERLKEERNVLLREKEILHADMKTHRELASRAERELAELQQKSTKQHKPPSNPIEQNKLKRSVEKLEEQRRVLQREKEVLQAEVKTQKDVLSRSERELAELQQEKTKQLEPSSKQQELYQLQCLMEKLKDERRVLQQEKEVLQAEVKKHQETASRAERELTELQQESTKQLKPLNNQIKMNQLQRSVEKLQEERSVLLKEKETLQAKVKTHQEAASRADRKLAELQQEKTKQLQLPNNLRELYQLKRSVEKLKEERKVLQQEKEVLHADMKTHRELASRAEHELAELQQKSTKQHKPPNNPLESNQLKRLAKKLEEQQRAPLREKEVLQAKGNTQKEVVSRAKRELAELQQKGTQPEQASSQVELNQLKHSVKKLQEERNLLLKENEILQTETKTYQEAASRTERELAELQQKAKQLEELKRVVEKLERQQDVFKRENEVLQEELKTSQDLASRAERELAQLQHKGKQPEQPSNQVEFIKLKRTVRKLQEERSILLKEKEILQVDVKTNRELASRAEPELSEIRQKTKQPEQPRNQVKLNELKHSEGKLKKQQDILLRKKIDLQSELKTHSRAHRELAEIQQKAKQPEQPSKRVEFDQLKRLVEKLKNLQDVHHSEKKVLKTEAKTHQEVGSRVKQEVAEHQQKAKQPEQPSNKVKLDQLKRSVEKLDKQQDVHQREKDILQAEVKNHQGVASRAERELAEFQQKAKQPEQPSNRLELNQFKRSMKLEDQQDFLQREKEVLQAEVKKNQESASHAEWKPAELQQKVKQPKQSSSQDELSQLKCSVEKLDKQQDVLQREKDVLKAEMKNHHELASRAERELAELQKKATKPEQPSNQVELIQLKRSVERLQEERSVLQREKEILQAEVKKNQESASHAEWKPAELQQKVKQPEQSSSQDELSQLKCSVEKLDKQQDVLQSEKDVLKAEMKNHHEVASRAERELAELQKKATQPEQLSNQVELSQLKRSEQKLQEQGSVLLKEKESLQTEVKTHQDVASLANQEHAELQQKATQPEQPSNQVKLSQLKRLVERLQEERRVLQREKEILQAEVKKNQESASHAEWKTEELQQKVKQPEQSSSQDELSQLKCSVEKLEKQQDVLQREKDVLKVEMKNHHEVASRAERELAELQKKATQPEQLSNPVELSQLKRSEQKLQEKGSVLLKEKESLQTEVKTHQDVASLANQEHAELQQKATQPEQPSNQVELSQLKRSVERLQEERSVLQREKEILQAEVKKHQESPTNQVELYQWKSLVEELQDERNILLQEKEVLQADVKTHQEFANRANRELAEQHSNTVEMKTHQEITSRAERVLAKLQQIMKQPEQPLNQVELNQVERVVENILKQDVLQHKKEILQAEVKLHQEVASRTKRELADLVQKAKQPEHPSNQDELMHLKHSVKNLVKQGDLRRGREILQAEIKMHQEITSCVEREIVKLHHKMIQREQPSNQFELNQLNRSSEREKQILQAKVKTHQDVASRSTRELAELQEKAKQAEQPSSNLVELDQLKRMVEKLEKQQIVLQREEEDLQAEIKTHQEVASRAEQELATLEQEIKQPESSSNQIEYHRLKCIVDKLNEQRSLLLEEVKTHQELASCATQELAELQQEAKQAEQPSNLVEWNQWKRSVEELHKERSVLLQEKETLQAEVKTHQDVASRATRELAELQAEQPSNLIELDQLKRVVEKLEQQQIVLQREKEDLQAEIKTHQEVASRAERELAALQQEIKQPESPRKQIQSYKRKRMVDNPMEQRSFMLAEVKTHQELTSCVEQASAEVLQPELPSSRVEMNQWKRLVQKLLEEQSFLLQEKEVLQADVKTHREVASRAERELAELKQQEAIQPKSTKNKLELSRLMRLVDKLKHKQSALLAEVQTQQNLVSHAQQELAEVNQQHSVLQRENEVLQAAVKKHQEMGSRAEREVAELQQQRKQNDPPSNQVELDQLESVVAKLKEEKGVLQREKEVLQAELNTYQEVASRAERELAELKQQEAIQPKSTKNKLELSRLMRLVDKLKHKQSALLAEVQTQQNLVSHAQQELVEVYQQHSVLQCENGVLQAAVKKHQEIADRAEREVAELQQQTKQPGTPSSQVELNQLKRAVEELEEQQGVLQRENEALQAEIKMHQELASRAERKLIQLQEEHAIVKDDFNAAGQRVKYLERSLKLSDAKVNKLRTELNIADSEKMTLALEVGSLNTDLQQQQKYSAELLGQLCSCHQSLSEVQQQVKDERFKMENVLEELNSSEASHSLAISGLNTEIAILESERKQIADREVLGRSQFDAIELQLRATNAKLIAVSNSHKQLLQENANNCQQLAANREIIEKLMIECRQLQGTSTRVKVNRQLRNSVSQTVLSIAPVTTGRKLDKHWGSQEYRRTYGQDHP